jgi:hypothetical protein
MKSFFAGLGIGAALGILFAPRSGDEIQDHVRRAVWLVRPMVVQLVTVVLLGLAFFYRWHKRATRPSSLVEAPSSTVSRKRATSMQF